MKLIIAHVGKLREPYVKSGVEHYRKYIAPYASLELCSVRQELVRKKAAVVSVQRKESQRMEKILSSFHTVIALDGSGKPLGSTEFARYLHSLYTNGRSTITFLIGGPLGLAPEVLRDARLVLSLSPMTLSHELTILVLLEQVYRALAYLNNHPYPK